MKVRVVLLLVSVFAIHATAQTYVAVGDSLAFGYQQNKFYYELLTFSYNPATFNTGFVDFISSQVKLIAPASITANFSCPGETTGTAISGGCAFHSVFGLALHNNYPNSTPQLQAAISYLQAHPGQVWMITITLGANDMLNLLSQCNNSATCVQQALPALIASASTNLQGIITVLKTASPQSLIVWTNVPDPYLFTDPANIPNFAAYNAALGTTATSAGARVVDWFGFQQNFTQAQFCLLSFVCTAPNYDIHPTDLGYAVLGYYTIQTLFQ